MKTTGMGAAAGRRSLPIDQGLDGPIPLAATSDPLADQLLRIAHDPDLRQAVYGRLGEYCHQCRNRLNSLKLSIYLAMKQAPASTLDFWEEINGHYQALESRVEQVQWLCRPISLSRVSLGLDLLIDDRRPAWASSMESKGRGLEVIPPADRAIANFDVEQLGRAIDAVVDWRAAEPGSNGPPELRYWVEAGVAHITWAEPGTPASPGLGSCPHEHRASTWALPLVARVILAHGGDYRIETDRGWRLEISWPSQPVTP